MGEITGIAWCHSTFNAWIGCTKIGPGCDNCYAAAADHRFSFGQHWGAGAPRRQLSQHYWNHPRRWERKAAQLGQPWRVFCSSQADIFDNEGHDDERARMFELTKETPHLTWLLLTKRIGNVAKMLPADWGLGYPNVWIGITVVNQEEFDRDAPKLHRIPAAVRWLSVEPQLGPIDITQADQSVDWVVVGGESRQFGKCRPFDVDWARSLRLQCEELEIAFFMKQLGHRAYDSARTIGNDMDGEYSGKGDKPNEWPEELQVREFPCVATPLR